MHNMKQGATTARPSLALALLLLAAQGALAQQPTHPTQPLTVDFPGFTIHLSYSASALETLTSRKETVIAAAYVAGTPKPHTPRRLIDDIGRVDFDPIHVEIPPGQDALFSTIKLDKPTLDHLDAQGPQLLINIYSGRKSSGNNLLDCGIYEGPLSSAHEKNIQIACKLIGEHEATHP